MPNHPPYDVATRDRVNTAIEQLGYVPSASARGLAARRTNVIGLFFPRHDDAEAPALAEQGDVPVVVGDDDLPEDENYYGEVLRGAAPGMKQLSRCGAR